MKKFAYLFPCGGQIEWSSEDSKSLIKRAGTVEDLTAITNFINVSGEGSFIKLSTGEFIFRTA